MTHHGHQNQVKPGFHVPIPQYGDPMFNPQEHAVALRMFPGSVFVGPNRYRTPGGHYVHADGSFRDPEECHECGSIRGEYRFMVRTEHRDPFISKAQPWVSAYTYCRRCCSPEEIANLRR